MAKITKKIIEKHFDLSVEWMEELGSWFFLAVDREKVRRYQGFLDPASYDAGTSIDKAEKAAVDELRKKERLAKHPGHHPDGLPKSNT